MVLAVDVAMRIASGDGRFGVRRFPAREIDQVVRPRKRGFPDGSNVIVRIPIARATDEERTGGVRMADADFERDLTPVAPAANGGTIQPERIAKGQNVL